MRAHRGQAFETMMLVISVIVAIAILGILLGFIGGIGTFGADARTVMSDLMKKVQQRGFGLEIKDKAEFPQGANYFPRDVVGESPVDPSRVKFACADNDARCSGSNPPIPLSDKSIGPVTRKITGAIAVCTNNGLDYWVCVASEPKAASEKCVSASVCNLGGA